MSGKRRVVELRYYQKEDGDERKNNLSTFLYVRDRHDSVFR